MTRIAVFVMLQDGERGDAVVDVIYSCVDDVLFGKLMGAEA